MKRTASVLITVALGITAAAADRGRVRSARPHGLQQFDRHGREVRRADGTRVILPRTADRPEGERRRLTDPTSTHAEDTAGVDDALPVRLEWNRSFMGVGIGATGLHVADLDADGRNEVIAGAGPHSFWDDSFWHVLVAPTGPALEPVWTSTPASREIASIRLVDIAGDEAPEILVGRPYSLSIHDGRTRQLVRVIPTASEGMRGLQVADVDGDGRLEFVFVASTWDSGPGLYVYDLESGAAEFQSPMFPGVDAAVANVDADPGLEIVVANGDATGWVLDGATRAVEWQNAFGFGHRVRVADLQKDGTPDIVAGFAWTYVRGYEAGTRALKWSFPVFNLSALQLLDMDGDGDQEIVYGDAQWGGIHVRDGRTRLELWSIANPEHGVTDVALGDVDGDGAPELLWGAGYSSTGPDYLYVADVAQRRIEWRSQDLVGPVFGLAFGDVDADGEPEILHAALQSDSTYGDGLWFVHDATTKALEFSSEEPTGLDWMGLWKIRLAQADADPQPEVLVITSRTYTPMVICYDGLTHQEQWRHAGADGAGYVGLEIADLDGDGNAEAVLGARIEHSGADGVFLTVLDVATGQVEYVSPSLGKDSYPYSLLKVANFDDDAALEIVMASAVPDYYDASGPVFLVDPGAGSVYHLGNHATAALLLEDLDGDGRPEIVIGTTAGKVEVLDARDGSVIRTLAAFGAGLSALALADLDHDGVKDFVVAAADVLSIFDGATLTRRWSSETIDYYPGYAGHDLGKHDSLHVLNVDADPFTEIVVNTGINGFRVYEVALEEPVGPKLTITMDDSADPAPPNGKTTYTVTVTNVDTAPVRDVVLSVEVPTGARLDAAPAGCTGTTVVECRFESLEPSQPRALAFAIKVRKVHGQVTATASVSGLDSLGHTVTASDAEMTAVDPPAVRVSDDTVKEGQRAVVQVRLSRPVDMPISFDFATSDGTATAGTDYLAASGTAVFSPGITLVAVPVRTIKDRLPERPEIFHLDVGNATLPARLGRSRARIHIAAAVAETDAAPEPSRAARRP
jgi:Calx-beta domain-containing protein/VCBS repeat protein